MRTWEYEINFQWHAIRISFDQKPRAVLSGTVEAGSKAMAAHRAVAHARDHSGNKRAFDRVPDLFITLREVE